MKVDNILWLIMERIEHLIDRSQIEGIDPDLSAFLLAEARYLASTADKPNYQFLFCEEWL